MPDIDFAELLENSLSIAKLQFGNAWAEVKPYAEHEFRQFAENLVFLSKLKLKGTIDDVEFASRIDYQKLATANVLITIKGISLVAAQNAVNAILQLVGGTIKTAIGVSLPGC